MKPLSTKIKGIGRNFNAQLGKKAFRTACAISIDTDLESGIAILRRKMAVALADPKSTARLMVQGMLPPGGSNTAPNYYLLGQREICSREVSGHPLTLTQPSRIALSTRRRPLLVLGGDRERDRRQHPDRGPRR